MEAKTLTIKLTPSEGKFLTQVNVEDETQRIYSNLIFISALNDSVDNWREADAAEKEAWDAEQEKRMKEEEEKMNGEKLS